MRYTKEELQTKSITELQMMDIMDNEYEVIVQEVLNQKLKEAPQFSKMYVTTSETDDLNPEKEAELQAKIDAQFKGGSEPEIRPTLEGDAMNEEAKFEAPTATILEPVAPVVKRFCEFCTAKGPIKHCKNCTKPK